MIDVTFVTSEDKANHILVECLLEEMHEENGIGRLDLAKMRCAVVQTIAGGGVWLFKEDGVPIATFGLEIDAWWYSADRFVGDRWLFIHPDHRSLRLFNVMVRMARHFAQGHKLPLVLGVVTRDRPLAKTRLYARHGEPVGGMFLMEGTDGRTMWRRRRQHDDGDECPRTEIPRGLQQGDDRPG